MTRFFFNTIFYSGFFLICIFFLPSLFMPKKVAIFAGRISGYWSSLCVKKLLGVKIIVKGLDNIPKKEKFFIACTHQSIFETFYLQAIFNGPIFILKKELLKIPIFGLYLKKIGSVSIVREKVDRDNLKFMENIKKQTSSSFRPLVIFPQGTRVNIEDFVPFKKGVYRIYEELKIKCVPVVMNSGDIWQKIGNLKKNKILTISILKPINELLDKDDFNKILEDSMYQELEKII